MLKVKAVIFDMDGLMVDTEPVGNMICVKANQKFGYTVTQEMLFDLIGRNHQSAKEYYFDVFGPNYPIEKIREEASRLRKEYYAIHDIEVKPGLYELLDYLKEEHNCTECATHIFNYYNLNITYNKYMLILSTVRSYLSYLSNSKRIKNYFKDNRLVFINET